eukprot:1158541_1
MTTAQSLLKFIQSNDILCIHSSSSPIQWINTLHNKDSGKTIHCSWTTFNYLPAIIKQLRAIYRNRKFHDGCGITSQYINANVNIIKDTMPHQYLRLKSLNGSLYWYKPNTRTQPKLSYRFAWWLYYFMRLFEKYGSFIPDTDFIIFMGDTGDRIQLDYKIFPFFVGDAMAINNSIHNMSQLPLFTVPRSYIYLHQSPVDGFADILCYRDADGFRFSQKKNAAIFRGGAKRAKQRFEVINITIFYLVVSQIVLLTNESKGT